MSPRTTIVTGGPILTMDPAFPGPEVVVVGDGRIVAVGDRGLRQAFPDAAMVDLAGRGPGGEPSGVLIERAWSDAHRLSLAAYADPDRWAEHIAARARLLLAEGVTAVHDAACPPEAEVVYRSMAATGSLPVSVLMMPRLLRRSLRSVPAVVVRSQGGHPTNRRRRGLGSRSDGSAH